MGVISPLFSSLKVLSISYKTPYEYYFPDTPTSLPTSEPATAQISYTVSEDDYPTLNMGVERKTVVACMYAGGKNTAGASRTIDVKMLKNGSEVASFSFYLPADRYWTACCFFYNVVAGDLLEIKLWATDTGVNWHYEARQLQFTRIGLLVDDILMVYKVTAIDSEPKLSQGNPYVYTRGNLYITNHYGCTKYFSTATDFSPFKQHPTYGLFRLYNGDNTRASGGVGHYHSSYMPYYDRNYVPTELQLRAIRRLIA